jgi:uncharacterized membrane protein YfcA
MAAVAIPAPRSIAREFLFQQAPLILTTLVLGFAAAYWQHGVLPGGDVAWPLAGVRVPVWHVIWLGVWTGYTMALVGEASGIFALPYSMSVLQFTNQHVTPSTQLLTFLNPFGALLGFRRSGQWNLDFARWVCVGGAVGGLIGPFLRSTVLAAADVFRFTLGLALAFVGINLLYKAMHGFSAGSRAAGTNRAPVATGGQQVPFRIETLSIERGRLTIGYLDQTWTMSQWKLFMAGALVGIIASALGVGGGFILVPMFVALYKLPMYVLPAATIPFVIVLSAVGLFTYSVILPMGGQPAIQPEWAWGLFAASGGIFGSWVAAKTQRYVPEHFLKLMLGAVTGVVGVLYVVDVFFTLPFKV